MLYESNTEQFDEKIISAQNKANKFDAHYSSVKSSNLNIKFSLSPFERVLHQLKNLFTCCLYEKK